MTNARKEGERRIHRICVWRARTGLLLLALASCTGSNVTDPNVAVDGEPETPTPAPSSSGATAGAPSAGPKEATAPDPRSRVRVRIDSLAGAPVGGVRVLFHDASGALLAATSTNGSGIAEREGTDAKMVTALVTDLLAVQPSGPPKAIQSPVTVLDVVPGEELRFSTVATTDLSPLVVPVTWDGPAVFLRTGYAGVRHAFYQPQVPSSAAGASLPPLAYGGGNAAVLVSGASGWTTAKGPLGGTLQLAPWVQWGQTGTIAIPSGMIPLDVTPEVFAEYLVGDTAVHTHGYFAGSGIGARPVEGPSTAAIDGMEFTIAVRSPITTRRIMTSRVTGSPSAFVFDPTKTPLPPLVTATLDGAAPRPSATLAVPAAFDADLLTAMVQYGESRWRIVAPPATTTLKVPEVPESDATWRPGFAASIAVVSAIASSTLAGYPDARKQVDRFVPRAALYGRRGLPTPGDLRISEANTAKL